MASLLRQIVASPRARHAEAGLDLCYVTDNIIATSGPSGTYPQLAYRNPLSQLVKFLDYKHGAEWAIWEFRAEGTGYPDSEVYNRVYHYPWPDHHPPPFKLIPLIMGSMRNWLKDEAGTQDEPESGAVASVKKGQKSGRVVVVHCKAGKGRSGTVSCSYLISEEGWKVEDALKTFTERRMRPGFGAGVSIPSQLRWVGYVDRWTKGGKKYIERPAEVLEIHIWGLRDGVKTSIEGFTQEGKVIKNFHTFTTDERELVRGGVKRNTGLANAVGEVINNERGKTSGTEKMANAPLEPSAIGKAMDETQPTPQKADEFVNGPGGDTVYRPKNRVILETSDINIDFERRNKASLGYTMVTAVAHVWFNIFFEGRGPEKEGDADLSGVFQINWDAIDGLKGSSRKGTRAFDKMAVVWKAYTEDRKASVVVNEPTKEEDIQQMQPADWRGEAPDKGAHKELGLRAQTPHSAANSRASSVASRRSHPPPSTELDDVEGVKPYGVNVESDNKTSHPTRLLPTSEDLPGSTHGISG